MSPSTDTLYSRTVKVPQEDADLLDNLIDKLVIPLLDRRQVQKFAIPR